MLAVRRKAILSAEGVTSGASQVYHLPNAAVASGTAVGYQSLHLYCNSECDTLSTLFLCAAFQVSALESCCV